MHEWMTDNGQTPHLVVDAGQEGVVVPRQYVRDGKIVLNVSYSATAGLLIKNDFITFSARFGGTPFDVRLPLPAVLGVYARETGQGMIFSDEDAGPPSPSTPPTSPTPRPGGDEPRRPQLKVVK
jgi:stringent starvation protein B